MEAANLPTFVKFGNAKSDICVIFAKKIMGGHETGGGRGPRSGPKTATDNNDYTVYMHIVYRPIGQYTNG